MHFGVSTLITITLLGMNMKGEDNDFIYRSWEGWVSVMALA